MSHHYKDDKKEWKEEAKKEDKKAPKLKTEEEWKEDHAKLVKELHDVKAKLHDSMHNPSWRVEKKEEVKKAEPKMKEEFPNPYEKK